MPSSLHAACLAPSHSLMDDMALWGITEPQFKYSALKKVVKGRQVVKKVIVPVTADTIELDSINFEA